MIDALTQDRLHRCVRRESRSLLQYAGQVPLWAAPSERAKLHRLGDIARSERLAAESLAAWLEKEHAAPPHLGPFPSSFASYNDAAVTHVLPLVVRDHSRLLADLESDVAVLTDPRAQSQLDTILNLKRRNAIELASLA